MPPIWRQFTRTEKGRLCCPRCGWDLGRIESPAMDYVSVCGGCTRGISVREVPGGIAIFIANAAAEAEFVDFKA